YEWKPTQTQDFSSCGDVQIATAVQKRGFALANDFFAQHYKKIGMIAVPRVITPQELNEPLSSDLAFVIVNPQVADLRLVSSELMQNHRIARQQSEEGYANLGIDTSNRHIFVRTKSNEK